MSKILEVYHAGVCTIECPDVVYSRRQLDFGPGFYITDIYEQAVNWALRQSLKFMKEPIVNKYLLNQNGLLNEVGERSIIFKEYDSRWLEFIVANRRGYDLWQQYDYIEGGVADDRVVDTIDLYMSGFIPKEEAIRRLIYLRPNNQICISSQQLLDNYLEFTGSVIIEEL